MTVTTTTASDYYEAEYAQFLMTDLRDYMHLFFATDEELRERETEMHETDGWNAAEGKYEVNDIGYRDMVLSWIYQIQDARHAAREEADARARWTPDTAPLTYTLADALSARAAA